MTVTAEPVKDATITYELRKEGPPVIQSPRSWCWWCGNEGHPPGWRGCPMVYVNAAELSPERRRLRALLS